MKKVAMLLLSLAVTAGVLSCNKRGESALTGAYGSSSVSGQVVVTGLPNTSPAGVRVSVRGTGMTSVLGPDGHFAFASMPEGATLDFSRAEDGIEASVDLDATASHVTVELGQKQANASHGRRRAAGRGGERVYEFEGLIRSAAADGIVVYTSKREEVTIGITPDTIVRKGRTILAAADLTPDTRVHVKARLLNVDNTEAYSAILVIVQNETGEDDGAPPAVREYEGTVVAASATELTVYTSHKETVKFLLTDETVIRHGSATFNLGQILMGMIVHVKATTNPDGTKTATLVIVQNTRAETTIEGVVASVGASNLVVTTGNGDVTANVSSATQIRRGNKKIELSAVSAGAHVKVSGTLLDATTVAAKKITVDD